MISSFALKATDVLQVNSGDLRDRRDLADDMELSRGASFNAERIDGDPISEIVSEYEQHVRLGPKDAAMHFEYGKRLSADIIIFDDVGWSFQERVTHTWAPRGKPPVLRRKSGRRELSTAVGLVSARAD